MVLISTQEAPQVTDGRAGTLASAAGCDTRLGGYTHILITTNPHCDFHFKFPAQMHLIHLTVNSRVQDLPDTTQVYDILILI